MPTPFVTFRNPYASVWQSVMHQALSARRETALLNLSSTQPEMSQFATAFSALQSQKLVPEVDLLGIPIGRCAKLAAEFVWAEVKGNHQRAKEIEAELKDGTCDPLWGEALAAYLAWKATFHPPVYVRYSNLNDFIIPLPEKPEIVIGLIADWGTGIDDAKWLLAEVIKKKPDMLIHLGDIYYAGMPWEDTGNFLSLLSSLAPNIPVFTLSGNHDRYSGGDFYQQLLGALNKTPPLAHYQQRASYFCLRNANWQILAMDTGLHDCDPFTVISNVTYLEDSEAAWHSDKLKNFLGRTVLLSHHQLFTAFGDGVGKGDGGKALAYNPKLYSVFQPFMQKIALWLWGHEHNFEVFDPYIGLGKGRCIGAAAIPVLQEQNPYGYMSDPDLQGQKALPALKKGVAELSMNKDKVYYHDYAILTLRAPGNAKPSSRIGYYQLDSVDKGQSQLMYGEDIS
ncbi:MAG TPA: metallophosphoesterase [Candidatus Acidoferrum sp.]|nr:metallophosphoesterase [Candidatus Acidoferrum sp.]